jgi:hypothetical protein
MAAARLLQRALLAEVKGEMKAKRAQLLETMRSMPDYSLQVGSYGRDGSEITDHGTLFVVVRLVQMSVC